MSCDNQISTQDLINAKDDATTLGEVATSRAGAESGGAPITQSTNRFGEVTDTVQGRLNKIGVLYDDPIKDWSAGLLVSDLRAHRYPATTGDVYIPVKPLPFTTGGAFNTNDWEIYQGVDPLEVDQILINDLSQTYEFETVAAMNDSLIIFPTNKTLITKGGLAVGDGLGATFLVSVASSTPNDQTLNDGKIAVWQQRLSTQSSYDNASSGLVATSAQAALDELALSTSNNTASIATNTSNISTNTADIITARTEDILEDRIPDNSIKSVKMSVASDADKLDLVNLSQEVIDALAGTAPVSPTIPDNSITSEKYAELSVIPNKTSFFAQTVNLYDESAALKGFFMSKSGALTANIGFNVSDFIEVEPSTTYTFSSAVGPTMRFYTAFDANEVAVFAEGSDVPESQIFVPASGVKFYKITVVVADSETAQLEKGAIATAHEPFGYEHTVPIVDLRNVVDRKATPESTTFLLETPNIYDKSTAALGFFQGSNGVPVADSGFNISDFIEVVPGETYTYSSAVGPTMRFYTAYDENKAVIQNDGSDASESQIFVPSSGIKYYKITVVAGDQSTAQLEKGAVSTELKGFGYEHTIPIADNNIVNSESSPYLGLSLATFGDSITQQAKWQPFLTVKFGVELTNLGQAGTTVSGASADSMNNDLRVDTIPLNTDVLTILGGTNDWAQSVPLGLVNSVDITEFYGAYNVMMDKIYTRVPNARILIMTTTYATFVGTGWPDIYTNLVGLTANDYAEACRVMAKKWNTPIADTNAESGWNDVNKGDYLADQIHPNSVGGERMAEVVAGRLIDLEPFI